ncbi:hypothetical protein NDU88_000821 [Pleurodeles waltl]|uniref:Uncharacterized protein n=1 Tax=Pleurodeles waltl TaxID=8319 RepID=A0AAV7L9R4_PLEWA|nr:hypothetical protein NDU88_000821 [Pleurodeles waltl]
MKLAVTDCMLLAITGRLQIYSRVASAVLPAAGPNKGRQQDWDALLRVMTDGKITIFTDRKKQQQFLRPREPWSDIGKEYNQQDLRNKLESLVAV